MLRLTARHADVWHSNAGTFEEGVALSKALDAACTKAGRDPASVRRSISMRLTTPDETLAKAKATVAAGFTEILVMIGGGGMPAGDPRKRAEEAAALLPRPRALGWPGRIRETHKRIKEPKDQEKTTGAGRDPPPQKRGEQDGT